MPEQTTKVMTGGNRVNVVQSTDERAGVSDSLASLCVCCSACMLMLFYACFGINCSMVTYHFYHLSMHFLWFFLYLWCTLMNECIGFKSIILAPLHEVMVLSAFS